MDHGGNFGLESISGLIGMYDTYLGLMTGMDASMLM